MEFRYRAVDGDRPSTGTDTAPSQPPNTTFSFFPARPMLGPSEDHVREAIQREIEKEQIRQEIIVAGTWRRRELVAEVLQEMAIEREMAIRRFAEMKRMSLQEKPTMWNNNQRKLPNQNENTFLFGHNYTYSGPFSLVTSSPMMQMPKATPVLESNKDKLILLNRADPIGEKRKAENTQTGTERAKRIAREDWSCRILKEHLQEKEAASKAKPIYLSNTTVKKQNELLESASTSIITAPASDPSPQSEAITVLQDANVEDQKVAAKETGKKTEDEKMKKVIIRCETCKIWTHSEQVMETHKLGKKHKALLEKHQYKALAVLDTNVITTPVRSLNAKPGVKGSMD